MKKLTVLSVFLFFCFGKAVAFTYPTFDKKLANGLKVIVCEKPGNGFAQVEVWYRVGSKDESPGNRGMAHMFEHMMFRGTKNVTGPQLLHKLDSAGASWNAYTSFDRTVYHEYLPVAAVEMALMLEADRMANLVVTQEVLNTERQVVGEEYRNGISNSFRKMLLDRYENLHPQGHPYKVDVIGHLDEITAFTDEQCMSFYDKFYSPNNAFLIVCGDVNHEEIFLQAEKYFGPVTKQLPPAVAGSSPDLFSSRVTVNEFGINLPLQDYCFAFPQPATSDQDYFAFSLIMSTLFTDDNSILNERLIKKEHSAYAIVQTNDSWSLYPCRATVDVIMAPMPGNVRVKKAIREEIDKVIAAGLPQEKVDAFIANLEASQTMAAYSARAIAGDLGSAEYYFHDYRRADTLTDAYRAVTQDDIKRVAGIYLAAGQVDFINIKPTE
ncbi:MAG TPA: pitrilysin family protein [Bacteroidia bacterium]|nr:pitrilysin family protein [Bacteroidia bacterium]